VANQSHLVPDYGIGLLPFPMPLPFPFPFPLPGPFANVVVVVVDVVDEVGVAAAPRPSALASVLRSVCRIVP